MPWELQVCRFCGKGYAHKTGLRNHLSQYVGKWRLPADGIHDVLEIHEILYPDADHREYRCPSRDCRKIIVTRQKFTEHVVTKAHWGAFPERPLRSLLGSNQDVDEESIDLSTISEWVLPFDEEAVKVFEPEGTFPFLLLPPELRLMIYEFTLCFSGIQFVSMDEMRPSTRKGKGKVYFQHDTDNNPLSLLITSRVIYEEARAVFYSKNEFLFARTDAIPIFLIGIGQANAMLLRSVRWWCAASQQRYVNQISIIRPYILGIDGQNPTSNDKLNIWNDHPTTTSTPALESKRFEPRKAKASFAAY
ncbi:hypothetical protein ZTR_07371 [Talaromyces verruculosus]|nr:hypothetical protein ZTR_07371 [Talaromyces verruculosus]